MKKERLKTTKRFRRVRLVPVIILIFIIVLIIGWGLYVLKDSADKYMVKTKIREGNMQAEKVFSAVALCDFNDTNSLNMMTESVKMLDSSFLGLEIYDGDELVYEYGEAFPDDFYQYVAVGPYYFSDTGVAPYLATTGNHALIRGMRSHFDFVFGMGYIKEDIKNNKGMQLGEKPNITRDWQDIWYEERIDSYRILSGHTIPITDADLQICSVTAFALHVTGVIIFLAMLIFVIRVIKSQDKVITAFYKDKETGGTNWYYFFDNVSKRICSVRRPDKCAVFLVKICKFNSFVSCFGEREGVALTVETYNKLVELIPKKTKIARHDRSDYVMFFEFDNEEDFTAEIETIFKGLEMVRPETSVTFAAGAYVIDYDEISDISDAYLRASIAADNAEANYANKPVFFNETMRQEIQWEGKMEKDLEKGLKNQEFEVYLQPKFSCGEEKLVAAEALVRWNHPIEGFLTPYKFIPTFEKSGAIVKLDDYMVSNVARIQSELIAKGEKTVPISVNISRIHFQQKDLAEHISKLVDEYNVPHNLIEIELTESSFFDNQELIMNTANMLRNKGFEVSLDDFGAGYSSLNSLRNIPIDIVKLDGGFFRGKDTDGRGSKIVTEVIHLAKQLNIKVVAEGIEERTTVDFLTDAGCDLIQGYYFAKPMQLTNFVEELHTRA